MKTASWVVRRKDSKAVLFETFSARLVDKLNTATYEAVPVLQYLHEVNRIIGQGPNQPGAI